MTPRIALALLLLGTSASAAQSPTLSKAIDEFDRGRFTQVRDQLERLASSGTLTEPDQTQALMYLGATYAALNDTAKAKETFRTLAKRFPGARMDPGVFVPSVVELAELVRAEELRAKPPLTSPVTTVSDVPKAVALTPAAKPRAGAGALALVPFGAGQFAKGDPVKGALFLGGEAIAFAVAGAALAMLESSKVESYGFLRGGRFADVDRARMLNWTTVIAFWTGVTVAAAGVADAVVSPAPPGAHP